jgi:hypothetical protein
MPTTWPPPGRRQEKCRRGFSPVSANRTEEVDRVGRGEIPSRLSAGSSGDGGVLEDLLEDKTIPLFRVRVKPPL